MSLLTIADENTRDISTVPGSIEKRYGDDFLDCFARVKDECLKPQKPDLGPNGEKRYDAEGNLMTIDVPDSDPNIRPMTEAEWAALEELSNPLFRILWDSRHPIQNRTYMAWEHARELLKFIEFNKRITKFCRERFGERFDAVLSRDDNEHQWGLALVSMYEEHRGILLWSSVRRYRELSDSLNETFGFGDETTDQNAGDARRYMNQTARENVPQPMKPVPTSADLATANATVAELYGSIQEAQNSDEVKLAGSNFIQGIQSLQEQNFITDKEAVEYLNDVQTAIKTQLENIERQMIEDAENSELGQATSSLDNLLASL